MLGGKHFEPITSDPFGYIPLNQCAQNLFYLALVFSVSSHCDKSLMRAHRLETFFDISPALSLHQLTSEYFYDPNYVNVYFL